MLNQTYIKYSKKLISKHRSMSANSKSRGRQVSFDVKTAKIDQKVCNDYHIVGELGSGAYGNVYKGWNRITKEEVAIKKIANLDSDIVDAIRIYREIQVQKYTHQNKHKNIIGVKKMYLSKENNIKNVPVDVKNFDTVYIVMEVGETDLHKLIQSYRNKPLTEEHYKFFIFQMIKGLEYLHKAGILHRDLKPSNIICNGNCEIKLIDFGLARQIVDFEMTEYVVTRWYRAPEIMISPCKYGESIDIWAIGCIFAEIILREPLFPTDNYVKLTQAILELVDVKLDDLSEKKHCGYTFMKGVLKKKRKGTFVEKFKKLEKQTIDKINRYSRTKNDMVSPVSDNCLDLLHKMLIFKQEDRITIEEIKQHPYVKEWFDKEPNEIDELPAFNMNMEIEAEMIATDDFVLLKECIANEVLAFEELIQ